MPKNLSVSTSAAAVEYFYPPIHRRMIDHGIGAADRRPTAVELGDALRRASVPGAGTALDAGCGGTGALAIACADYGFTRIHAVDLSQQNLCGAREVTRKTARRGIYVSRASVDSLPFSDRTFDFVVCSGVIHHTSDPERSLRELARVLKPGGFLYLSVYCFADSLFEWIVRGLRQVGRVIGFTAMHTTLGRSRAVNNFVLDHMYVPILWLFRAPEIRRMLERLHLTTRSEFPSRMDAFAGYGRVSSWISGDGLIRVWICQRADSQRRAQSDGSSGI